MCQNGIIGLTFINGEEGELINIAKNMLKENVDIDVICKVTGLEKENVKQLK